MTYLASDSIFWVEVDKIQPNPYQPRREFDEGELRALSDSIRQYGVLQPLVVTRKETEKDNGGIEVRYELIAGERRLRASKLAGLSQVPCVIRTGEDDNLMKLELAIIENLQREDLNPVDRAKAFQQFVDEFNYKHSQIAKKVGKSREYVSNSLRLLSLPDEVLDALVDGRITEGHARPIMMLKDKPEEQMTLFKEIMHKKLTVRDAESIARRSARDKIRKKTRDFDPQILQLEKELTEQLGTRVHIEPREVGGKITIDFFSDEDLKNILGLMNSAEKQHDSEERDEVVKELFPDTSKKIEQQEQKEAVAKNTPEPKKHEHHDIGEMVKPAGAAAVGTVAFGGKPKENIPNNPLGDVLRDVLAKEKNNQQPQEKQTEEKTHEPAEEPKPDVPEEMPPAPAPVHDTPAPQEANQDDDLDLPDMTDFRSEVDSLLHHDSDDESLDSSSLVSDDVFEDALDTLDEQSDDTLNRGG